MNYFRCKQFNKDVITVAVGYYLRYALSYRDISEILRERGINVHHSTIYRWVQEYAPILYQIWKKKHKKAYYKWRVDETYIKIKGTLNESNSTLSNNIDFIKGDWNLAWFDRFSMRSLKIKDEFYVYSSLIHNLKKIMILYFLIQFEQLRH
ncbi:transposase IS66 family protein [Staphylococcus intermedius NCTC 11048]|uniref:Transposase IS66 family protein n=1 Tax=Staphylococcus intermedius NCTC 11048 TaxID=1141106 RepID=A0A380FXZ3_STAIN|nr:transposase IS66 family protein [Staphylococcus intermedius NCTC 11048]